MNIRQAIFVSVASAGVVASSWFAGPTSTAQTTAVPAYVRLGGAHAGTTAAMPGTTTAVSGPGPAAAPSRTGSALLSPVSRGQLRSGTALQLVSGPEHPASGYPPTLQAVLDRGHL